MTRVPPPPLQPAVNAGRNTARQIRDMIAGRL